MLVLHIWIKIKWQNWQKQCWKDSWRTQSICWKKNPCPTNCMYLNGVFMCTSWLLSDWGRGGVWSPLHHHHLAQTGEIKDTYILHHQYDTDCQRIHHATNTIQWSLWTKAGYFGASHVVLCREAVLFSEVQYVYMLWERYFEECPLQRSRPFLRGSSIGGFTVSLVGIF